MAQNKIILYYQFAPIADPQAVMLWQRALCEKLGLRGRILISKHGINGTLGGNPVHFEATGWFARCMQHETDHLDGKLYIDVMDRELTPEEIEGHIPEDDNQ